MSSRTVRVATVACSIVVAVLVMPSGSAAGCCGWFHHEAAPVAVAAPIAVAPPCASCPTPCATQTCGYMPTVVYRALYQPAVVTAYPPVYQPVYQAAYAPASYAVTAYRPPFAWAYQGSLVPYTTYRPLYTAMPVVAYQAAAHVAVAVRARRVPRTAHVRVAALAAVAAPWRTKLRHAHRVPRRQRLLRRRARRVPLRQRLSRRRAHRAPHRRSLLLRWPRPFRTAATRRLRPATVLRRGRSRARSRN